MDLGEALSDQVVLSTGRERSRTDALASGLVVDGTTRSVRLRIRSTCSTRRADAVAADIRSVRVVQVEEQARRQAHRLDGHELIRDQAAKHTTNDRERDV